MNAIGQSVASRGAQVLPRRAYPLTIMLVIGAVACGSSDDGGGTVDPKMPGSLSVTIQTTGFMKDDSYELLVNGTSEGTIGANAAMTISELDPATYEVSLASVADNCEVESIAVAVVSEQTAEGSLDVVCTYGEAVPYTIRFSRDRPNLENGEITECSFGICPSEEEWDVWAYNSSSTTPHAVIRQNQTTEVEIAHLPGVSLETLTEADVAGATFTTELVADPFDTGRVILIRTDVGNVYALGNPVEDTTMNTLDFDVVLLVPATP